MEKNANKVVGNMAMRGGMHCDATPPFNPEIWVVFPSALTSKAVEGMLSA